MTITVIISISPLAAPEVLSKLSNHSIPARYVGIDNTQQILMELSYPQAKAKLVDGLCNYSANIHKAVSEVKNAANDSFRKLGFRDKLNLVRLLKAVNNALYSKPQIFNNGSR